MRTSTPLLASALHAIKPAGPAPIISTSTCFIFGVNGIVRFQSPRTSRCPRKSDGSNAQVVSAWSIADILLNTSGTVGVGQVTCYASVI